MLQKLRHPFILRLFLLRQLPLAYVAGLRLRHLDLSEAITTVPFGWMTKNPFRSMYFAAQAIAAEFSTGILAALHLERAGASVAMLIVHMEAEYLQKATAKLTFRCTDGEKLGQGIYACIQRGEPVEVVTHTTGTAPDGTEISKFTFTWSFKAR